MRTPFETERGDEFMSLVYALNAEAEGPDDRVAGTARTELEQILAGGFDQPGRFEAPATLELPISLELPIPAEPEAEPVRLPAAPPPAPARPTIIQLPVRPEPSPVVAAAPTSAFSSTAMVDELTGIGGPLALRRDLILENSIPWPGGPRYTLITLDLHPLAEVRASRGPHVADRVFRTLVEAVGASAGASDAIYRSGQDELTLLLRGPNRGSGEQARIALESSLRQALAERGLPRIRLATEGAGSHGRLPAPKATAV